VALVVVAAALGLALVRPVRLFAVGMMLLAVESARIFGVDSTAGKPATYKLLLYACALPVLLDRGVDRKKCAPLIAYLVVVMFTETLATPLLGLTTGQTASSLATLCLGWVVFAVRWEWSRDHHLLKVLAWVPTVSLLAGAALQAAGILSLFRATPPRLEGATLAASLGALGVCAVVSCLVLYRREAWSWAGRLGLLNVVILGATLSRGAALALAIAAVPLVVRFARRQLEARGIGVVAKVGLATIAVMAGAVVLGIGLVARSENATDYVAGRGLSHEVASGRFEAWKVAYDQAKVNIAFGRGLGAGPLVGETPGAPQGFTAQHSEYVRMLLEGGVIGAAILLLAIGATLVSVIRCAPSIVRADLAATCIAFAIYSATENTLTTPAVAVSFLLLFGVGASRRNAGSAPRPVAG
jgi:teichuronic acid biosynthesis protein TuaE